MVFLGVVPLSSLPPCVQAQPGAEVRILPRKPTHASPSAPADGAPGEHRLKTDLVRLRSFSGALAELEKEMNHLRESIGQKERDYYTSDEHDRIESLLFRYLACRESLWDMIDYYSSYQETFPDSERRTKGFLIGFSAANLLSCYSSKVVATFLDKPVVIGKLNEKFFRLAIPRGTYDNLFKSVTSVDNLSAMKAAWLLYGEERKNPESTLSRLAATNTVYRELMEQSDWMHTKTAEQTDYILEEKSFLLPNVRNRIRHAAIHEIALKAKEKFKDNLYAARGILSVGVSRIKSPLASELAFSPSQVRTIKSKLRPGDVILTFTEGYMCNIFLPGTFKHGMTYVGSPEERREAGLTMESMPDIPPGRRDELSTHLSQGTLPTGEDADLVESVAEGVVFSSLDHILETHINRLLVLRPCLTEDERVGQLATVFLLLGNTYDFKFDFSDASHQCCTEVIYRALHKRGTIEFSLIRRMGNQTLSADDIIRHHMSRDDRPFEFVLLAERDPEGERQEAVVQTGREGEERLNDLMESHE